MVVAGSIDIRSQFVIVARMTIVILGAGAIGTLYGAWLSSANDVTLIARRDHAERIAKDGVRITGLEEATYRLQAATAIRSIERDTVVFLTTKVTGSAAAVAPIVDLLRPDTTIVCLQNGLDSEGVVSRLVGDRCLVIRGITHFGAIFAAPGVVALKASGYTLLAPSPRSAPIAETLTKSRLDGRVSTAMKSEIWRKLIFNCVVNPLTAMTRMEVGWISDERLDPVKRLIIEECLEVARREGVTFDVDFVRLVNETFRPSRNFSSMHQDLVKGKVTEIDHLNGAVVDLGRTLGVSCPANQALVTMIKALESASAAATGG
jgi:2-dehydropantoate 2-reductase